MDENIVDSLKIEISSDADKAIDGINQLTSVLKKLQGVTDSFSSKVTSAAKSASKSFTEATVPLRNFSKKLSGLFPKINQLFTMFNRRILYRAMNALISTVIDGFKEGIDAVYQFSKALNGTFANALDTIATSSNYLKASLGAMASPLIELVTPAVEKLVDKFVNLLNIVNQVIARLAGKTTWTKAVKVSSEYATAVDSATSANETFKKSLLGFDEINALQATSSTATSGISGYEFIEEDIDTTAVDEIIDKLQTVLEVVETVGAGFLAWKIASTLIEGLSSVETTLKNISNMKVVVAVVGLAEFIDDIKDFVKYFKDFLENGATFDNVVGMLSSFTGALGDVFLMFGKYKIGGALKLMEGLEKIVKIVKDIAENGWDNSDVLDALDALCDVAIGIGALTGHLEVAAWATALDGLVGIIEEIYDNWEAIKQGDWSGVDKGELAIKAIQLIGGVIAAIGTLKVASIVAKLDGANQSLTTLAKNLAIGLGIIAEIAAAVLTVTGTIVLLGKELEEVGEAWQPVIDNAKTVATAMGIGVEVLVAVGVVAAALGSLGTELIVNIGIGTAILVETDAATLLFLAEIWAIGKTLNEVGEAWQPVLDNGDNIATAIGIGTGLLVAVGVVAAALGAATVATGVTLPIAIGLGTALLLELSEATVLFTESLVAVADEFSGNLSPALDRLNEKLPTLTEHLASFVDFMIDFAGEVVRYSAADIVAGLAATIDTIIGWFTRDPIKKMAKDIKKVYEQTEELNDELNLAVPELKEARNLLQNYQGFLQEIEDLTSSNPKLSDAQFANMKEVGQKIVTGFVDGIKSKKSDFTNVGKALVDGFKEAVYSASESCKSTMTEWASSLKEWFTDKKYGAVNSGTWQGYAKDILQGFSKYISSEYTTSKSGMNTWGTKIKEWFWQPNGSTTLESSFKTYGKNVVQGFIDGIDSLTNKATQKISELATLAKQAAETELGIGSPSKKFREIGKYVVEGFNTGISGMMSSSLSVMRDWANDVESYQPDITVPGQEELYDLSRRAVAFANNQFTSAVNSNDTLDSDESLREMFCDATSEQNALLREEISILRKLLDKDTNVTTYVSADSLINGLGRKNRRDGKTIVPVGV